MTRLGPEKEQHEHPRREQSRFSHTTHVTCSPTSTTGTSYVTRRGTYVTDSTSSIGSAAHWFICPTRLMTVSQRRVMSKCIVEAGPGGCLDGSWNRSGGHIRTEDAKNVGATTSILGQKGL
eukprot:5692783-Prymnesium_polylepis.2